jgi:hypothetical protein
MGRGGNKKERAGQEAKVDIRAMSGPCEEAKSKREKWSEQVEKTIIEAGESGRMIELADISKICLEEASKAVREAKQYRGKPWIQGREEEVQKLQAAISGARSKKREWRELNRDETQELSFQQPKWTVLDTERKYKRKIKNWEWGYWDQVAQEAIEAHMAGDVEEYSKRTKSWDSAEKQENGMEP